jgi:hypothetical protein
MAKGNTWAAQVLALYFNATTATNLAINATSSPATNIYVSLHTANPGAGGSQTTSEAAYTGYARVAVARTTGGWTVTGESVSPAATIVFPQATGGSETETYFGIGLSSSGAGTLDYFGQITTPSGGIVVANTVTPELTTSTAITES